MMLLVSNNQALINNNSIPTWTLMSQTSANELSKYNRAQLFKTYNIIS